MCIQTLPNTIDKIINTGTYKLGEVLENDTLFNDMCDYILPNNLKIKDNMLNKGTLNIVQLNVHGVTSKSSKIIELLDKIQENGIKIDVVLFCETFLKDSVNTNLIKGYQSICINCKNMK